MRPPENLYHQNITEDGSRSSCSLNRCNLSPWIIGSEEFQANPLPVEIDGARTTDGSLFRRLGEIADAGERSRLFHDYVCVKFGLNEKSEHGHLMTICDKCGFVREIDDPTLSKTLSKTAKKHGHILRHHVIELHGVCWDC